MKPGKGLRRTGFTNRGKPLRRYTELRRSSTSGAGSGTTGEGGSVVSSAGRPRATRRMPAEVAELVKTPETSTASKRSVRDGLPLPLSRRPW
jgi:hypothetical protein